MKLTSTLAAFGFAACAMAQGASHQFDVNTKKLGAEISPTKS